MQKITTPNGETLVVLPLADYEKLVDGADIASADKVRADIASGRDEMVPSGIVDRILAGENPVRVWRSHRGLSARDLATATGLSAPGLLTSAAPKSKPRRMARICARWTPTCTRPPTVPLSMYT